MVYQLVAQAVDFEKIKAGELTNFSWNTHLSLNAGDIIVLHPAYKDSKFTVPRIGEEKIHLKVLDVEYDHIGIIKREVTKVKFKISERKKVLRDG